jgi:hypothetical protein
MAPALLCSLRMTPHNYRVNIYYAFTRQYTPSKTGHSSLQTGRKTLMAGDDRHAAPALTEKLININKLFRMFWEFEFF